MERVFGTVKWLEERGLRNFLAVFFLLPTGIALAEVFRRYALGLSWDWNNDVVVYGILAVVFLHLGATERLNTHLRVTVFVDYVRRRNTRAAAFLRLLSDVISVAYVGMFVYLGVLFVDFAIQVGRVVPSRIMPLWPSYAILVLGFAFLGLWLIYRLYADAQSLRGGRPLEDELLADEELSVEERSRRTE